MNDKECPSGYIERFERSCRRSRTFASSDVTSVSMCSSCRAQGVYGGGRVIARTGREASLGRLPGGGMVRSVWRSCSLEFLHRRGPFRAAFRLGRQSPLKVPDTHGFSYARELNRSRIVRKYVVYGGVFRGGSRRAGGWFRRLLRGEKCRDAVVGCCIHADQASGRGSRLGVRGLCASGAWIGRDDVAQVLGNVRAGRWCCIRQIITGGALPGKGVRIHVRGPTRSWLGFSVVAFHHCGFLVDPMTPGSIPDAAGWVIEHPGAS